MFDVITFGSAIRDDFLILKPGTFNITKNKKICFHFGSKIFLQKNAVFSGGGAVNTASGFARRGFSVGVVTKVGQDKRAEAIIEDLKNFGVDISLLKKDKNYPTSASFVLSSRKDRTILISQGACHHLREKDISWSRIASAKWFYIAPLSGESKDIFEKLVYFAQKKKISIAANPSLDQLSLSKLVLKKTLSLLDVLLLNREEAEFLLKRFGLNVKKESDEKIVSILGKFCPGKVVVTLGTRGVVAFSEGTVYRAGIVPAPLKSRTGAGDAFGSGFVSVLIKKDDIEEAIFSGLANAAGCVSELGATRGLLDKNWRSIYQKPKIVSKVLKDFKI